MKPEPLITLKHVLTMSAVLVGKRLEVKAGD